jgi:NAD(P)-dependent dehydrogenase (short-subunit alcohol dehydrogenase family)
MAYMNALGSELTLKGRVCLVTGGANGIGLATAVECARRGASVAILDLDEASAHRSAATLTGRFGTPAMGVVASVTDAAAIASAVRSCEEKLGRVDILVNSAGILAPSLTPVSQMPTEDVERMFQVHVLGAYLCSKAVLPGMTQQRFGRIINISSILGLLGGPLRSGYTVAKHAIIGFTRSLAVEVARDGITVNAVAPGYIFTEIVQARMNAGLLDYARNADRAPVGRWGVPAEIGHAISFLALPASGFITGVVLPVDGGYSMRGDPSDDIGPVQSPDMLESVRAMFP